MGGRGMQQVAQAAQRDCARFRLRFSRDAGDDGTFVMSVCYGHPDSDANGQLADSGAWDAFRSLLDRSPSFPVVS